MTKLNKLSLALAMAAGVAFTGNASAFVITSGAYKMTVDAYLNGSIYAPSSSCGGTTASAANIASCDAGVAIASVGTPALSSEDTWGIVSISSITNTTLNTTMFSRGTDGYIIGYFGGLTDFSSTVDADGVQTDYSTGGFINLYLSTTDYDPTVSSLNQAAVFGSVTTLPSYLEMVFVNGATTSTTGQNATYKSVFDQTGGPTAGSGFLNVVAGSAMAVFDQNGWLTGSGATADAKMTVTISQMSNDDIACTSTNGNPADLPQTCNWLSGPTADVRGNTIPEPASLALLGLGLFGLGAMRRRA